MAFGEEEAFSEVRLHAFSIKTDWKVSFGCDEHEIGVWQAKTSLLEG